MKVHIAKREACGVLDLVCVAVNNGQVSDKRQEVVFIARCFKTWPELIDLYSNDVIAGLVYNAGRDKIEGMKNVIKMETKPNKWIEEQSKALHRKSRNAERASRLADNALSSNGRTIGSGPVS